MARRRSMTGWYNPAILAQTGIRVAVSTVFGQFFDKREAMAAANAIAPQPFDNSFDYSRAGGPDGFWFDYLADTGDGWNPTFAMARLLAKPKLTPDGEVLERGRLLVLGGDQVYPTASRKAYGERLLAPLETATEIEKDSWPDPRPDMYVIPGNHDWYDGLNSFFGLFCRRRIATPVTISEDNPGRMVGGWQTQQSRSYFAIKLPGGWWLWGTDSQLGGYIDQPQLDFFRHVAKRWMAPQSKLILCVAEPAWTYVDGKQPDPRFDRFAYLEELVAHADRGHSLKIVLTGDSHHYSRFTCGDVHYVTCGGGGAFLHPTHQLRSRDIAVEQWGDDGRRVPGEQRRFEIARKNDEEDGKEALYPSRRTSARLAWRNLIFAALNPWFTFMLFLLYLTFNWMLNVNAQIVGPFSLVEALQAAGTSATDVAGKKADVKVVAVSYWRLLIVSPWTVLLMIGAIGAYYYFADSRHSRWVRFGIGLAHWGVQTAAAIAVTWWVLTLPIWPDLPQTLKSWVPYGSTAPVWLSRILPLVTATAAAAIASATLFGIYLLVMLNLFGRHANEAFSSLRIAGFKSFLRFRIDPSGKLTVHAVGLRHVPSTRCKKRRLPQLQPHLIERFTVR